MGVLEGCKLCGGLGFLDFHLDVGSGSFRCPACGGAGALEPWRQGPAGGACRGGRASGSTCQMDGEGIRATLRVRAEREFLSQGR